MEKEKNEYEFVEKRAGFLNSSDTSSSGNGIIKDTDSSLPLLSFFDVSKSYGTVRALSGVSFSVGSGKVVGLLGPNGSGKTTVIKLIAGLLKADSGEILILGEELGIESKRAISYLPERNSLPLYFTVGEAISYFEDFFDDFERARAEEIIRDFSIGINKKIKILSKGEREKLGLALVMSRRARLYILDEPISGVDPAARAYIIGTVLKNIPEESSILISTHLISDIETIMDEFIFMKYGEIYVHDTPERVFEKYGKTVDEYFKEVFKC